MLKDTATGARDARGVPILMYHQVSPRPHPMFWKYTVTPRAFATQMRWLTLAGYVPISLDRLLEAREGRATLPRRPTVISFDDGYQDCVDHAVPILQAHGFTATFFLVAGLAGRTSRWLRPLRGLEFSLMDWGTARTLETVGFRCASHSVAHPRLTTVSGVACRQELAESRQLLEDHLGHPVEHLAYPFGSFDARVRALAAEVGYRSACTVRVGVSGRQDDPLTLPRVPVTGRDTLLDFVCRLRTASSLGDVLRGKGAALRRRLRRLAWSATEP